MFLNVSQDAGCRKLPPIYRKLHSVSLPYSFGFTKNMSCTSSSKLFVCNYLDTHQQKFILNVTMSQNLVYAVWIIHNSRSIHMALIFTRFWVTEAILEEALTFQSIINCRNGRSRPANVGKRRRQTRHFVKMVRSLSERGGLEEHS